MKIAILLYDDVEVLDAFGPFEVFSVADRVVVRDGGPPPFEVLLVRAGDAGEVRLRGGLPVRVDLGLDDVPDVDVLLVPGGVTDAVEADERVLAWLAARSGTPVVASVCTGAFLLAGAGLVTDQRVTTHWEDAAALRARFPSLDVVEGPRWVHDRRGERALFTSAGISAGLDLALHLVSVLTDDATAVATARQMDYAWEPGRVGPARAGLGWAGLTS